MSPWFWPVFSAIVAGTLVLNVVIAFFRRRDITFQSYGFDPNSHSSLAVCLSLTATIVGGGMFLATGQMGYEAGIVGYLLGAVYLVGMFLMSTLVGKMRTVMDKCGTDSLLGLVGKLYGRSVGVLFSVVCFFIFMFLLAGQFVAMYTFAEYISTIAGSRMIPWGLTALAGLTLLVYPVVGGLRKDIQTDIAQMILIFAAAVVMVVALIRHPVAPLDWRNIPTDLLTGKKYGAIFIVGLVLFYTPSFFVRMDFWQRVRAARSPQGARWALVIAGILSLAFFALFTTLGVWARVTNIPNPDDCTLQIIQREMSAVIPYAIVIAAFFAAVLSSADTFINNCSLFLTCAFWPTKWQEAHTNNGVARDLLIRSRIFAVVVVLVAAALAHYNRDFVDLLVGAFSVLLIFIPVVFGLFDEKWRSTSGAMWSSIIGVVIFLVLFFGWNPKYAFAPAVVISIPLYFAIARRSRGRRGE